MFYDLITLLDFVFTSECNNCYRFTHVHLFHFFIVMLFCKISPVIGVLFSLGSVPIHHRHRRTKYQGALIKFEVIKVI